MCLFQSRDPSHGIPDVSKAGVVGRGCHPLLGPLILSPGEGEDREGEGEGDGKGERERGCELQRIRSFHRMECDPWHRSGALRKQSNQQRFKGDEPHRLY